MTDWIDIMVSLPSSGNYYNRLHVQPLPQDTRTILLDRNAPPSSAAAWNAAQNLRSTELKSRSQVSVENGEGHPRDWGAGEYAAYYFDTAHKYNPWKMLVNLFMGKGLLDPLSKIGRVNQLFDKDFAAAKRQMVDSMMEMFKDSIQQLPDGDPVKNVMTGKADIGERRLQLSLKYKPIVGGRWDGQISGLELYVKPRYNPAPDIKIGGETGAIEAAEERHAYKRYTFSFSTGALRRLSKDGMNGPDAFDSLMVGHPGREDASYVAILGSLDRPHEIPETVFEVKDMEAQLRKTLDNFVESYREPLREAKPVEIVIGLIGDFANNLMPGVSALEAVTDGDIKRFAIELGLDAAKLGTAGGMKLIQLLKAGAKLEDVVKALLGGIQKDLPPGVGSIIAPSPRDPRIVYRHSGPGIVDQFKDQVYNRAQDIKYAAINYIDKPVEEQAVRAAGYADTANKMIQSTSPRYKPPMSRDEKGDILPIQLFGFAYNQPSAAGSYGAPALPVAQSTQRADHRDALPPSTVQKSG